MKNVLITGGSGSFGQAFTQRTLDMDVERIVIYSRGEHAQEEMARKFNDKRMRYFIGDVRDKDRLDFAMRGIDTVVHAAALKIVPTAEYNPTECIATNVTGAENVVKTAIRAGVARVVALSTDKAVNPVNLYGASKLAAERIFVAANALAAGQTRFSVVRYGNVVGSRGSVLPLFQKLAREGKQLPITDARMTRFWIDMDAAIKLVLFAEMNMFGSEVFIPKIPSIRILDLARAVTDNGFYVVGIRPGEKLHEVLVTEDEARETVEFMGHYVIYPGLVNYSGPGKRVQENFRYASDTNKEWLDILSLRRYRDG
jgi:UDP-N-acetylglucosamine 4,6-dehydratase